MNNILYFEKAQDIKESLQGQKSIPNLDFKTWSLPGIPEETSPEIRGIQIPKVLITDVNGVESDYSISLNMQGNHQVPVIGGVPRVILTDVDGKVSLPIVPNIVITDADGNITEEIIDYIDLPRSPMVNSFSDSSMDSVDSQTTLNASQEDKNSKASKKFKDSFKPLKGLKKKTSRLMQSVI